MTPKAVLLGEILFPSEIWKHLSFSEGTNLEEILVFPSAPYEEAMVVRIISLLSLPKMATL